MNKTLRNILTVVLSLGLLGGVAVLAYPLFSNLWNNYRDEMLFNAYIEEQEAAPDEEALATLEAARAYNDSLGGVLRLQDSFGADGAGAGTDASETDEAYNSVLNADGEGLMGYVSIPKVDVRLPIYHGTSSEMLERGVGHLYGSSLPVGGEGTHAVLSAHRGLPEASLFTDLDQLEVGDQFYLYVQDEVLAYEVDQIKTVDPTQTEDLQPVAGADLVTLVTCTPYGVNTHRLLVRGHRVDYVPQEAEAQAAARTTSVNTNYVLWLCLGLAMAAAVIAVVYRIARPARRRTRKGAHLR